MGDSSLNGSPPVSNREIKTNPNSVFLVERTDIKINDGTFTVETG